MSGFRNRNFYESGTWKIGHAESFQQVEHTLRDAKAKGLCTPVCPQVQSDWTTIVWSKIKYLIGVGLFPWYKNYPA
jgi:hypothetical protein